MLYRVPSEFETEEQTTRVFEVNYFSVVRMVRKFFPLLKEHQGRIVLVGSAGNNMPVPFLTTYVASKAALMSYANALRVEIEPQGVAITYISLGTVKTDMLQDAFFGDDYNNTAYQQTALEMKAKVKQAEALTATVEQVAPEMAELLFTRYPPCISYVGMDAKFSPISAIFPQRVIQAISTKS